MIQPRGFCAGVVRAVDIVTSALKMYGPPVYVLHEIVHNRRVVSDLEKEGAIFVERLDEIPDNQTVIFSAHGVSYQRELAAKRRNLHVIDATCPLVSKVHREVTQHSRYDREVILIGHEGHVEVNGTLGRYHSRQGGIYLVQNEEEVAALKVKDPSNLGYVTQTTLSQFDTEKIIDALKERFPAIKGPNKDDICYATQNRQNALVEMANKVDLFLVVGAKNSSNSNRLREVGESMGVPSYLIQSVNEIDEHWFHPGLKIGITAGASTPEVIVQEVVERLKEIGATKFEQIVNEVENVHFPLPSELKESLTFKQSKN